MSVHTQTHAACGLEKPGYSWFRWRKGEAMEISPGRGSLEKGSISPQQPEVLWEHPAQGNVSASRLCPQPGPSLAQSRHQEMPVR